MASPTTLRLSTPGLPIKIVTLEALYVAFEVEYLWNGWVKKDGFNAFDKTSLKVNYHFYLSPVKHRAVSRLVILNGIIVTCLVVRRLTAVYIG